MTISAEHSPSVQASRRASGRRSAKVWRDFADYRLTYFSLKELAFRGRVLKGEMTLTATKIPAGLKKIPPFPPIAARLLVLLANPSAKVGEIADLICSDATFTARVLQHANSAAYCFPSPIESVSHAIPLIGIDRTRELVAIYGAGVFGARGLRTSEMRTCWQHSIATAVIAEQIAKGSGVPPATAFTAGIMHDIGRLGLLTAYPQQYEEVIRNSVEKSLDILDFEREKFGLHHAEAGLFLAQLWRLPPEFQLVAGRHHDPCEGLEVDLLKIVHVACRAAQVLGYDIVQPLTPLRLDDVLAELPPSTKQRLQASAVQLSVQIERRILEYDCEEPKPAEEPAPALEGASEAESAEPPPEPEAESAAETGAPEVDAPAMAAPSRAWLIPWAALITSAVILAALLFWSTH